jgi:hypothetical protein
VKFVLAHDEARRRAIQAIQQAEQGHVVTIKPPTRSLEANAKFHAMIGDIARQFDFHGKRLELETFKRLAIDQFRADTKDDFPDEWRLVGSFELSPSLDGSRVVMLGPQSRKFPGKLARAFVEWLYKFAADNEIDLA